MSVHLARGTRDFLPEQAAARHRVLRQLRSVFARHGFEPLETPAVERIETLTSKYGEEGGKLMYRILKRGAGSERGECDLALRYDLTVPLARVVAMNPGMRLPFKRWQAAPVWRAERPAAGRYREFWQCDCDIVGSADALADAQCVAVAVDALRTLGFQQFTVRLNDRRLLRAIARRAGAGPDREVPLLVAIDKLDKLGRDGVDAELDRHGFDAASRAAAWEVLSLTGPADEMLCALHAKLEGPDVGAAVDDLRQVMVLSEALGVPPGTLQIDPTLARGLDYYTGPVFEVAVEQPKVGALAGGGRYDDLIGVFGKKSIPAVGVALGLERILLVMEALGMGNSERAGAEVMVAVYGPTLRGQAAAVAQSLRTSGRRVDLYIGEGSMKSQFKYANAKGISVVALIGPDEAEAGTVVLRDMEAGEQRTVPVADAADAVAAMLS